MWFRRCGNGSNDEGCLSCRGASAVHLMRPVSCELGQVAKEVLFHTGQQYDDSMSGMFFRELDLPEPGYHLAVGQVLTDTRLVRCSRKSILLKEEPDVFLIYGDTNSTFARSLAAAKPHIPVSHVEAGLRSHNRERIQLISSGMTDHLSALLLCPTETAVHSLSVPQLGM